MQGLGTAEVGNNVGRNETDALASSAELTSARDVACALEHRLNGLSERLDRLVKQVDDMYDQISENELICERTISSLGRYVFGSEISYKKPPPRLPGLGC